MSANFENDAYRCPGNPISAKYITNNDTRTGQSYDMHSTGVSLNYVPSFGLNSAALLPSGGVATTSCKESDVVAPVNMIAYGDCAITANVLAQEVSLLSYRDWFGYVPVGEPYDHTLKYCSQRHRGLWNINFADGHNEHFKKDALYGHNRNIASEEGVRKRWNRDYDPHWEAIH